MSFEFIISVLLVKLLMTFIFLKIILPLKNLERKNNEKSFKTRKTNDINVY